MNKTINFLIALVAIMVVSYVLYDHFFTTENADSNQQRLEEYLETGGHDRQEEEEYAESNEFGAFAGMMAPPFSLPSWDETDKIDLSDYAGNFVIINAWASWCPPCRDEIPYLIEFHENYSEERVEVLGINMTTAESNEKSAIAFINEFNIPYDIAMDPDGYVFEEYQVMSMPMTFVVDPEGRIVIRKLGYMDYDMIVDLYNEAIEIYES